MNECEYGQRLSAYHDGEVTPKERQAIEDHLGGCPACAAELKRLRRLSGAFASSGRPQLSPEAAARLHRTVDRLSMADLERTARTLLAVAASILVVCGVWLWQWNGGSRAAESIPVWETVAAQGQVVAAGSEEQLARWMVQDLERKNGHD